MNSLDFFINSDLLFYRQPEEYPLLALDFRGILMWNSIDPLRPWLDLTRLPERDLRLVGCFLVTLNVFTVFEWFYYV